MNLLAFLGVLITGYVVWLTQGRISPETAPNGVIGLSLLGILLVCSLGLYGKKIVRPVWLNIANASLIIVPILTTLLHDNLLYPNLAEQNQAIRFLGPLQVIPANVYFLFHGLTVATALCLLLLFGWEVISGNHDRSFLNLSAILGLGSLSLVLLVVPFPWIDVFTGNTTAVIKLLEGSNPYGAKYLDLYGGRQPYAPSFGYLPGYFLFGIPALLLGDVRVASIVSLGVLLFWVCRNASTKEKFNPKHSVLLACIIFGGSSFYIIEQAWIDPILAICLFISGVFIRGNRSVYAGFFLGLALSIKQYGFIGVGPLLAYTFFRKGKKEALATLVPCLFTVVLIIGSFWVWGPEEFLRSTFSGIKNLPVRLDSLSIRSFIMGKAGYNLEWISWLGPAAVTLGLLWKRKWKINTLSDAFLFSASIYLAVFFFSSHAFANYYYFVYLLFLFGLILSGYDAEIEKAGKTESGEATRSSSLKGKAK